MNNVLTTYEGYNTGTVMDAANLPSIRTDVATATNSTYNDWSVTPDAGNTGSAVLNMGKAFAAFLTGKRYFEVRVTGATTYDLYYRDNPSAAWVKDSHSGTIGNDEVFTDAKAFILGNWWDTTAGPAAAGDKFRFEVDPNTDIVDVPVLFKDTGTGATAFTSDCVNALVDGDNIISQRLMGQRSITLALVRLTFFTIT